MWASGCASGDTSDQSGNALSLKVGVIAPFTVKAAFVGPNVRSGLELAKSQIKAAGGPAVELLVEDDQGALDQSISALQKLTSVNKANMIVGPTSLTIISMLDRIKRDGTTHMIAVGSTSSLDDEIAGSNIYRVVGSDSLAGPAMAQVALDGGFDSCASLFEDQESAQSVKSNVEGAFTRLGGRVGTSVDLAVGQTQYRSEALKLFSSKPRCVFFQTEPENAGSFAGSAAEFREQLADTTFISTDVAVAPEMLEAMAPVLKAGAKLVAVAPAPAGKGMTQFIDAFKAANGGKAPEVFADTAYDALNLYALAVVKAGTTERSAVDAALVSVASGGESCVGFAACQERLRAGADINYEGASGNVDFDEKHNVIGPFGVFALENGKQKQVRTIDETKLDEILKKIR